ncbi:MAG: hypothetical protein ACRC8P_00740 [Spiroplasma sp.]
MKKSSLFLSTLIVFLLGISFNFQKSEQLKFNNIQYVTKNITISNIDDVNKGVSDSTNKRNDKNDFLNIKGQNFATTYRIFLDSTGDKSLPSIEKNNDYLIGKGNKNDWYNHLIIGLSLDISKYASNKNEFLNKYKSFTVSYLHASNFWNSWKKWTNKAQKGVPLEVGIQTFNLSAKDQIITIFNKSDDSHSNNERTRLIMKQTWNQNILNINWELGAWYNWVWASPVHHAALGQFTNDNYIFSSIPKASNPDSQIKSQILLNNSRFSLITSSEVEGLNEIDDKLKNKGQEKKIKDSLFKFVPLVAQSYAGVKIVKVPNGTIIYILAVNVIWYPPAAVSLDSLFLLNNLAIKRTITSVISGSSHKFVYENNIGTVEETNSNYLPPQFFGMQLSGFLTVPFIYII